MKMTGFVLSALLLASLPSAAQDDLYTRKPDRVWKLTKYLHGTTAEVRDQLNGELERQLDKQEDAEKLIRDLSEQLEAKNAEAVAFTRTRPDFLKLASEYEAGAKERDALQAELEKARAAGGSSAERLDLSARYNRVRLATEKVQLAGIKMVQDAPLTYVECIDLRQKIKEAEGSLGRCKSAVEQSAKWRDELIDAMRVGFALQGPLISGSKGLLGRVTCEKIVSKQSAVFTSEIAWGRAAEEGQKEGITTVRVRLRKVYLAVSGVDTSGMKEGSPVTVDRTVSILEPRVVGGEVAYLAQHVDSDVEELVRAVVPLLGRDERAKRKAVAKSPTPATRPVDELTRLRMENEALKAKLEGRK